MVAPERDEYRIPEIEACPAAGSGGSGVGAGFWLCKVGKGEGFDGSGESLIMVGGGELHALSNALLRAANCATRSNLE